PADFRAPPAPPGDGIAGKRRGESRRGRPGRGELDLPGRLPLTGARARLTSPKSSSKTFTSSPGKKPSVPPESEDSAAMEGTRAPAAPKPGPELASLRIRRDPERSKRPTLGLILGAVGTVALAVAAYFTASYYLAAVTVEQPTAALVTQRQALPLLTVSGYARTRAGADLSPNITS